MGDGQVVNGQAVAILTISAVFSFLAILSVGLRFLARRFKGHEYFLDDWLIVLGLIITLGVTINNIVGVAVGGIGENENYRTSGPSNAIGFPYAKELLPQGKVMFALQILHTCAMPVIKASVLAFYLRLFPTPRFRIAVYALGVYVFCWWISILFATIFQCHPISDNWGTEPIELGGCYADIFVMYQVAAVTNMASDVAILALPFPIVLGLFMPMKHKIAVLCIFLTGSLVVAAGIGRTVAYFKLQYNHNDNFSYWYYPLVVWTSVEPTVGVISACLPTLRPLFSGLSPESILGSIRSALSLHSNRSTGSGGNEGNADREHLPQNAVAIDGSGEGGPRGMGRLPDPNGSRHHNEIIAIELQEWKKGMKEQQGRKFDPSAMKRDDLTVEQSGEDNV